MKKIKMMFALLFLGSALTSVCAAGADIVVLMDSSGTILPWFEEINNRVLVDLTKKFVRSGDTFHLISFNSRVNLEIAQPIESEEDLSRVVSRFMLLYPLGQNSDFLSGLQYTVHYVSSLDQQRQKIIIVISDGIFNPPASSPYASYTSEQIKAELSSTSRRIRGAGWNVYYIKLPFPQDAVIKTLDDNLLAGVNNAPENPDTTLQGTEVAADSSAAKNYYDVSGEFTDDLGIQKSELPEENVPIAFVDKVFSIPRVTFPDDLGKQGRFFLLPLRVSNDSDAPINLELTDVFTQDGVDVLYKTDFLNLGPHSAGTLRAQINLPKTYTKGPQDIRLTLAFSNEQRVNPQSASMRVTITDFSLAQALKSGSAIFVAIIFVVLAILLVLILFVFIMKKTSRPASDAILSARRRENDKTSETERVGASAANSSVFPMSKAQAVSRAEPKIEGRQIARGSAIVPGANAPMTAVASGSPESANSYAQRADSPLDSARAGDNKSAAQALLAKFGAKSGTAAVLSAQSSDEKTPRTVFGQPKAQAAERSSLLSARSDSKETYGADIALSSQEKSLQAEQDERSSILVRAAQKRVRKTAAVNAANPNETIASHGSDRVMLELFVDRQATNIGKRNVHVMKPGSRLSVGGGQSPFLVFLVRFPPRIAEIRYDGISCSLALLKPEYFPEETETVIPNCVDRTFKIVSDHDYEVTFSFKTYEDPVKKLNRLLTSISY